MDSTTLTRTLAGLRKHGWVKFYDSLSATGAEFFEEVGAGLRPVWSAVEVECPCNCFVSRGVDEAGGLQHCAHALRRMDEGPKLTAFCALIPVADTLLMFRFLGVFVGTISILSAALLFLIGGALLPSGAEG